MKTEFVVEIAQRNETIGLYCDYIHFPTFDEAFKLAASRHDYIKITKDTYTSDPFNAELSESLFENHDPNFP